MKRRLIAFLLSAAIAVFNIAPLSSCSLDDGGSDEETGGPTVPEDEGNEEGGGSKPVIVVPEYKDYERRTVNFEEITYFRPDMQAVIADFEELSLIIEKNEISYEEQLEAIYGLEEGYESILSMGAYSRIMTYKDSSDEYWQGEYGYISENYPSFSETVEDLFVAAAASPHALRFEEDYFGEGLIEEYADGGIYTDELVALFEEEARLTNDYSSLSTASVVIEYKDKTDTYDNILAYYRESYGEDSSQYKNAKKKCDELYGQAVAEKSTELLIELFKTRSLIGESFEGGYAEYAYDTLYHDYTKEQMLSYLKDIADYIVPVYSILYYYIFSQQSAAFAAADSSYSAVDVLNTLYGCYEAADSDIFDIYCYMLQHGLYDVSATDKNRFEGSFTTYIDSYDAPYLFITASGTTSDYMTVSHELGHFIDAFVNYNSQTSLDLMEISSTAFEFLTLLELDGVISEDEYNALVLTQLENAFICLMYQGFYALFEHYAYNITYDNISEQTLIAAMRRAAADMGMNPNFFTSLEYIMIPHLFISPFYVQAYCTSTAVAIQIYYKEAEAKGEGLAAYKELVRREDDSLTLEEYLDEAGLDSPFDKNYLRDIANLIHYDLLGSNYFHVSPEDNVA